MTGWPSRTRPLVVLVGTCLLVAGYSHININDNGSSKRDITPHRKLSAPQCRCVYPGEMHSFDPDTKTTIVHGVKVFSREHVACQHVEYICEGTEIDLPDWNYPCEDDNRRLQVIKRPLARHQLKRAKEEAAVAAAASSTPKTIATEYSVVKVPSSSTLCKHRPHAAPADKTENPPARHPPHHGIERVEEKMNEEETMGVVVAEAEAAAEADAHEGELPKPAQKHQTKREPKPVVTSYTNAHSDLKPIKDKHGKSVVTMSTANMHSCKPIAVTFDRAADGRPLAGGQTIRNEWLTKYGFEVTAHPNSMHPTILDSSNPGSSLALPKKEIKALGSPNRYCPGEERGGPGVGKGGEAGEVGENCAAGGLGNLLVAYQRSNPGLRGNTDYGKIQFSFSPSAAGLYGIDFLNVEQAGTTLHVTTDDGITHELHVSPAGTNGVRHFKLDFLKVQKILVDFGSASRSAISSLDLCIDDVIQS